MLFQSKNPENSETMIKQKKPENLGTKNLVVFKRKKQKKKKGLLDAKLMVNLEINEKKNNTNRENGM